MAVHVNVLVFALLSLAVFANCQSNGDIRLNSYGTTSGVSSGRLEVYYDDEWGTVCDDSFFQTDADVACRQLGFSSASSFGNVDDLVFSRGTGSIWLDDVTCSGSESRLGDCNHLGFGNHNCEHFEDVALRCTGTITTSPTTATTTTTPGTAANRDEATGVRLVGNTGLTGGMGGRVEVYYRDRWYTIQDSSARDNREASVICRQLGFSSVVHYGDTGELGYTENSAIATLSFFSCLGSESRWTGCSFTTSAFDTSDSWAVTCAGTVSSSSPQDGDIRLNTEGTSRPFSGRLEVYYSGQWGTVCDDGFGQTEADIACRQLGLHDGSLFHGNVGQVGFGQGSGPIWLDSLSCSFTDTSLFQCTTQTIGFHNCGHNEDVAVVCIGEGSVRVSSANTGPFSATLTSGRLEIFAGGRWGTVCDDFFGQTEADVACRGIGQGRADSFNDVRFSSDFDTSLPILLDDVGCTGSETNLLLCSHRGIGSDNCGHSEDIEISCSALSTGAVVAIGITVPLAVIAICIIACCVCCCYCAKQNKTSTPRTTTVRPNVVRTAPAVTTTTYTTTTQPQGTAYPLQQVNHQAPYPTQSGYAAPYPSAYPSAPHQQPPAAYPTGQAPPAPYSSGPQAPPAPHSSTQVQSGEEKKPKLYPDAPPAYGEVVNYPGQYPGYDLPQQQQPQPQYF